MISAQKANTANAFSLDASSASNGKGQANGLALSKANLFTAVQPGGSLYDISANPDGTGGTGQAPNGSGGVGMSASGFGHPKCLNAANPTLLPAVQK